MQKKWFVGVLVLLVVVVGGRRISNQDIALLLEQFHSTLPFQQDQSASVQGGEEWHSVKRVVDGDTIELESGEKVRYIGVNAPESVKPNSPMECFGHEASTYNKTLVEGKRVRLEKDVSERDKYGRLLRFVYLEDGTLVNDQLVREGYAFVSTFPPDVGKADQFKQAQAEARAAHRGLWAMNTCNGKK